MVEREISLDTETTGLSPQQGHRIVEIGCVEMENRIPTGNNFHVYINPERDMPEGAFNVHGLSEKFLSTQPVFSKIVDDFVDFIGDAKLIIHNAQFDVKFINAELTHARKRNVIDDQVFCTLKYARKKFPGSPASLDALCKRFGIDLSTRTKHGALLDAELLADMYLELMGGSQVNLDLSGNKKADNVESITKKRRFVEPRTFFLRDEEEQAHREFIKQIKNSTW